MSKWTVGELTKVLSEMKPETPVVLHACCKDDEMQTTWCEDFKCWYDLHGTHPNTVIIGGVY